MSSQVYEAPRQGLNSRQVETVEKLLSAGLAELREVGHEALTIRSVAQRANVSAATAYTYLASKQHLYAELFWRHLTAAEEPAAGRGRPVARVQAAVRALVDRIVAEPQLAAAVTPALLGSSPDVERLRLKIGGEFIRRFEVALVGDGPGPADPAVLDTLVLSFSGGLLQAGMGVLTYDEIAERLVAAVEVIMGEAP